MFVLFGLDEVFRCQAPPTGTRFAEKKPEALGNPHGPKALWYFLRAFTYKLL